MASFWGEGEGESYARGIVQRHACLRKRTGTEKTGELAPGPVRSRKVVGEDEACGHSLRTNSERERMMGRRRARESALLSVPAPEPATRSILTPEHREYASSHVLRAAFVILPSRSTTTSA